MKRRTFKSSYLFKHPTTLKSNHIHLDKSTRANKRRRKTLTPQKSQKHFQSQLPQKPLLGVGYELPEFHVQSTPKLTVPKPVMKSTPKPRTPGHYFPSLLVIPQLNRLVRAAKQIHKITKSPTPKLSTPYSEESSQYLITPDLTKYLS